MFSGRIRLRYLEYVSLLILFALATYIIFYKLGSFPLENWDEAWLGDALRYMMRQKEYVVLYWNKAIWLDKPPLYLWLSVFFSKLLGESEFSLRLTSAISAFALIIWVTLYSYKNFGYLPSLLAFSTLALNNVFIWRARSGNLDALSALLVFATYFLILSKNKYRYLFLGILFSAIYMTKLSLVFFPISIFVLHDLLFQRKNLKNNLKEYLKLIVVFISIPAVWLTVGYLKIGVRFVDYYLFWSDQGVTRLAIEKFKTDYFWYAYWALQRRFFWVFLMGIILLLIKAVDSRKLLLIFFSLGLLIALSFTEKKNNWYLVPSMPFWSITIAYGAYRFIGFFKRIPFLNYFVSFMVFAFSFYVSYRTYMINIKSVINSRAAETQANIGKAVKQHTGEDEIIVRLDHLYPTMIYYSDRKVLSSPEDAATGNHFLSRKDLLRKIDNGEISYVAGKKSDLDHFRKSLREKNSIVIVEENDEQLVKLERL